MISRFFIDRPIFASVLSAIILIAGLTSIGSLPIAQFPDILPPEVQVAAFYPGASAEVVGETVAAPLEQQINGVEDMLYVRSSSTGNGALSIAVTFKVGTDPDLAAINVNNRVQAALPLLPEEVRRLGVTVRKQSSQFLAIVTLDSPDQSRDAIFLSNYTLINVLDELKRIPGVGDAQIFGAKDYSIRIWMRPDAMARLGLTPADVAAAVREQNSQFAAGRIGAEPQYEKVDFTYTVSAQGRLKTTAEFEDIVLRTTPDGAVVRMRDIARVELGSRDYDFNAKRNGKPTVPIGIFLQPGANALDTYEQLKARLDELAKAFPPGVVYTIPFDTTQFVRVSIIEVVKTLLEAMALVFLVVFVFLQNWRATLIPTLAVPVSLVGAFAGMYALGFSINTLTLFGMVLAIGIVVDDAIVVLENVERIMSEEGLSPRDATIKAMEEVTGPVIAIVLVLCAVFVPIAFLGGLVGEMYRQFAITIAVSVVISGFVALTLTPALCALILRPEHKASHGIFDWWNRGFLGTTGIYLRGVRFFLRHGVLAALLIAAMIAASLQLFRSLPASLAPEEDQGWVLAAAILPDAASLSRAEKVMDSLDAAAAQFPGTAQAVTFSGFDVLSFSNRTNTGVSFITLKDFEERKTAELSSFSLVGYLFGAGAAIKDAFVLAINPPPINGLSTTGGFEGFVQSRAGGSLKELEGVTQQLLAAARERPELAGLTTSFSSSVPQMRAELDREKAKRLGIPIDEVFAALQSTFGALYVNDFNLYGRTFRVHLQSEPRFRAHAEDLRDVYVRAGSGELLPLTTVVTLKPDSGAELVERYNVFPAAKIFGGPAPGFSSGAALAAMEETAKKSLPTGYTLAWTGSAFQEKAASGSNALVFGLAVLMVYLILAAQYEKLVLPFAVILAVPFALFGAALAVYLRGLSNDLYFQIGLITLIGLAAKNAILIVEFAAQKHAQGLNLLEAATEAARLRFRPIVMTSLAFILGVTPLAISTGAGSASRHSIGTGVIGGMLAATFLATLFVPLFFAWVTRVKDEETPAAAPPPAAGPPPTEEPPNWELTPPPAENYLPPVAVYRVLVPGEEGYEK